MGVWDSVATDAAAIIQTDGVEVRITPATGEAKTVKALWQGLSLEGGELDGPRMWCADADLPADLTQGDTVAYPIVGGTTYAITHRDPDGHGMSELTLIDESTL